MDDEAIPNKFRSSRRWSAKEGSWPCGPIDRASAGRFEKATVHPKRTEPADSPLIGGSRNLMRELEMSRLLAVLGSSLALSIFSPMARADGEAAGGIVYGSTWAFIVTPPHGWEMTTHSGLAVAAAFFQEHPAEPVSGKPPAFMYVAVFVLSPEVSSLDETMSRDEADFRATAPSLQVADDPPGKTLDGMPVPIRRFDHPADGRSELVAYLQHGETVYKIVLTAPTADSRSSHQDAFRSLLSGFLGTRRVQDEKDE